MMRLVTAMLWYCVSTAVTPVLTEAKTSLGACDYQRYPSVGCRDELGAHCDEASNECHCKADNDVVLDQSFCFPKRCNYGHYYDHSFGLCVPQRKPSPNSDDNQCKHDFHCRGNNVHCQRLDSLMSRCVCNRGYTYDSSAQECQVLEGLNGFCRKDPDCDTAEQKNLRKLYCVDGTCQCATGFTFNLVIDGCEDNESISSRDGQTRTLIYLFIVIGIVFGVSLTMKFASSPVNTTRQMLLKRMIERRQQEVDSTQQSSSQTVTINSQLINGETA